MGSPRLVFILGTAFCGSTLLGQILSNRPGGLFVGELYDVHRGWREAACSCRHGSKCAFWKGIDFDDSVYRQLLARWPGMLVDASKYPEWILPQAGAIAESRVVVLFRDPENFVFGWHKRRQLRDWGGDAGARATVDDRLDIYAQWYRAALGARLDGRIHFLSYDGFASKPTAALQRLHRRLGTTYHDGEESFWEKPDNHILGSNGDVLAQIRRGQRDAIGSIERRDHRALVRAGVPGWTERARAAAEVHLALLERESAQTDVPV